MAGETATFSYPNPGVYIVNLNITDTNTDPAPGTGCTNTNLINQVIQVGTEPDFSGTQAAQSTLCFGDTTTIAGVVTPVEFINDCTPPVSGTTFLPDGNGATYQTCVTVDCYDSAQTVTDINQIIGICVNMEHSYLGDLDINIISPTGAVAILKAYPGGGGTYLGGANDDGSTTPGVGADYCFSTAGTVTLENGPTITAGSNPAGNSITPGTYLPEGTLNTLLGSPLNGDWCIQIIDNLGADNGFIFSWSIEFDPNLQPPELSFTPTTVTEGWDADTTITNTTGNTITVAPPTAGQHCYTYRTTDDFGCEYEEVVCIDVLPEIVTAAPNNLFLCNPGAPPYIFDLTQNDAIINGPATNPADQIITYYETQADADNETNPIANPTAYSSIAVIGVPETLFVRIEYLTSGCFETYSFTLNITAQPVINPALDMVLCDDISNDDTEPFDLESQNLIILGTQPATDYTVTYYASLTDAAAGVNSLVSLYNNTSNPQPIFVRVELTADATCVNVTTNPLGEFNLIVNPSPEITSLTSNTDICSGEDATFTITGTANHIVDYNINAGGTQQVTLDAAGQAVVTVAAVAADQVITLESVVDPATTCTTPLTNTLTVVVNANPTVVLTSNTSVCSGADAIFTITGDAGNVVDYNINAGGTLQATLDAAGEGVITITGATLDQIITLESVANPVTTCSSVLTDTNTVTIGANPVITSLTTNTDICSGADAIFTINGTADDVVDYTINGGATQQVTIDATGQAVVTITTATVDQTILLETVTNPVTFCFGTLTDTATVTILPNPTVTLTSNTAVCIGDDAVFTITGVSGNIVDYNINGGGTLQATLDAAGESVITIVAPTVDQAMNLESVNNPTTTCTSALTDSNTVTINPLPTIVVPTPLEVCDDGTPDGITEIELTIKNNEISGGNPAYAVTYYFSQADADAQANPLASPYTNVVPNMQTIFVGVQDVNTGCYDTTTLDLVVEQAPVAFTPANLEYCDPDSDGFGVFTLTDSEAEITGGAPGLTVTYHETMSDADNNVNALASPYNNIVVNMQTIYVRVESSTIATDCATFVDLVLIVNPTPQITTALVLTPLEVCDDNADGFATFDLPTKDPEILNLLDADTSNDLDPTLYTITYYTSEANAEAPTNAIATPNAYVNTTANMQTIWVRVEDNATACYKTVALELIVNPLPVLVQPTPLSLCDVNNPGDEVEAFNLEDANAQILAGQTGITLTYFSTQAGADTNDATVEIVSPYSNTSNAQTVYVRATNNVTGCVSTITLDLRVNPLPSPVAMPLPSDECDDDNDGFYDMFDLDGQSAIIANGEPDITISYYETEADAMSMTNPLVSPYANIVANLQTVYVLAENDITGCFTIVTMDLVVLPSPVVPIAIDDYIICDDDNDGVNQFDFDAVITPQIFTGGQTAADFVLTYHTTQALADSGNNPIVNTSNYTNVANPQTIYIRLVSNANGCVTTGSFIIRVEFPPVIDANYDNELTQCDDLDANYMEANDGFTSFDLTVEDIEITGVTNVSWIVTYYETLADAQADTNAIADPTAYTNIVNGPQTVYVRVTDSDTGCFSFTTVTIRVIPNPSPSPNPVDLELCDDIDIVGPNDLLETFDLTQNEGFIINGEVGVTASYYITQDDAVMGNNAIVDPTQHINEDPANPNVAVTPQTIFVRLTNGTDATGLNGTGCYSLVSFDVIVNPLPVVTPVNDYVICELNTDNVADFDLTTMTAAILNGQDPLIFTVTYHETQGEADASMNDLTASGDYTNTSDPQTIYVNITNTVTGCDTTALTFNLVVDEAAQANPDGVAILYQVCDDTMEFDNDTTNDMVEFDLATQNPFVLDGQDPLNYTVTYYDNQVDADAGTNPLPFTYTNTVNPQVIIVRVDNDIPGTLNLDLTTLTVGLDVNGDGTIDTIDTTVPADGIFDIVDINGDGVAEGFDTNADGIIDYIDLDGDGLGDLVDLNNDGEVDNDTSACYETAEITLQVNPMPSFTLEAEYLLCINTNGTEVINSPVIDTGLDPAFYTFVWNLNGTDIAGQTAEFLEPTEGGTYGVIATDIATGCPSIEVNTFVTVSEPPAVAYEITSLAFADQHDILVTATGTTTTSIAVYEFSIDGGSWELGTLNAAGAYVYTFTDVAAGEHMVTVRDTVGCGETTIPVMVMDYPLYFTPNGDGYHDTWNVYDIGRQPDAVIYIFDRYGKLLKQLSPAGAGWDGTYNGNPMPTSDYWFTLEYREPSTDEKKSIRRHFTLKR
ncbi:hypothetical protein CW733_09065 [Lacinutrix sp. Bg11-31]|nr:hypothetical protein CW733_09065 [Lacinutrix sp. Bg11-31]